MCDAIYKVVCKVVCKVACKVMCTCPMCTQRNNQQLQLTLRTGSYGAVEEVSKDSNIGQFTPVASIAAAVKASYSLIFR